MLRLIIILLLVSIISFGQSQPVDFSSIDGYVKNIEAPTADSLARKITSPYKTELEKTRAVFSWIAQHISYNLGIYNSGKKYSSIKFTPDPYDTVSEKSAIIQTAEKVLRRRVAICDGYAKLFKTLCDYSGIQSELILGYAKCYLEKHEKFRTNHTWNAVKIDSSWYLLDVTWGSGYVNNLDQYVQQIDETYFLAPARQFALDHYPEDLRWTLLEHPPTLREFQFSPFKYKTFVKYNIRSVSPSNGTVEAAIGDTIQLELQLVDANRTKLIAPDPFFDSAELSMSPASAFLQPVIKNNTIVYTYIVQSDNTEWLHLLYNDDPILRYKLNIRKPKTTD